MRYFLCASAMMGFISVLLGALGDHGLALNEEQAHSFDVAVRYQMLYAILVVVILIGDHKCLFTKSALLFFAGAALFAGGIYISLFTPLSGAVYLTPIGGVTLMAGWLSLAWCGFFGNFGKSNWSSEGIQK